MCDRAVKFTLILLMFIFTLQYSILAQETPPDHKAEKHDPEQDNRVLYEDMQKFKELMLQYQMSQRREIDVRDVEFELGNNPARGSVSAPLVIVQFSDYTCHYCARHSKETYPEIYKRYIETGKVRYVIIDNPLPGNEIAMNASKAAHCADEQGKFWEMHHEMTSDPEAVDDLTSIAAFIELNTQQFDECMKSGKYTEKITANISLASELEIPSVPGFVIASGDPKNPQKVKGISYIRGAKPFTHFQQEIDKALGNLTE